MESWRIFHVAKEKLEPGVIWDIFRRSSRLITYWAANPRKVDEIKRNPLDRVRLLLDELNLAGYGEYARAAIDYMAEPLGGRFADVESAKSDKDNIDGEIADISIAIGDLAGQVRDAKADGVVNDGEIIRIKKAARSVRREVEQLLDAAGVVKGTTDIE